MSGALEKVAIHLMRHQARIRQPWGIVYLHKDAYTEVVRELELRLGHALQYGVSANTRGPIFMGYILAVQH